MDVDLDGLFRQNTTFDYDNYEDNDAGGGEAIWIPVVYSVVLLVGLVGNGLLLAVLAQKRQMWSLSDTFILHLGVADVLLLMTLPFRAAQANHHLCHGIFCKICGAVFNISFYSGIFLLGCITLDHYLSTIHAVRLYSHKMPHVAHISCLLVWLASLLLSIPDWVFLEAEENLEQGKFFCVHNYKTGWQQFSRLLYHIVGFLLPTATLIWCVSHILLRRQRSSKGLGRQRALRIILPLVVGFFACWTPYNVTLFVDTITNGSGEPENKSSESSSPLRAALAATSALACVHACLRPLLYLLLCGNFKKRIQRLLKCTTVRCESSLWELGVGEEAPHDQGHSSEEIKQMSRHDQQVQL